MKPAPFRSTAERRQKLAAIHVAKGQLGLDDSTYRELVERVSKEHGTACRSAADLDARQASYLLDEMRRLGAPKPKIQTRKGKTRPASYPGRPHNMDAGELSVIEAQLTNMGLAWSYADAIAQRMYGIERVAWVRKQDQLKAILAALHVEQEKRTLLGCISDWCKENGFTVDSLAERFTLPANWKRNRRALKAIRDTLVPE